MAVTSSTSWCQVVAAAFDPAVCSCLWGKGAFGGKQQGFMGEGRVAGRQATALCFAVAAAETGMVEWAGCECEG